MHALRVLEKAMLRYLECCAVTWEKTTVYESASLCNAICSERGARIPRPGLSLSLSLCEERAIPLCLSPPSFSFPRCFFSQSLPSVRNALSPSPSPPERARSLSRTFIHHWTCICVWKVCEHAHVTLLVSKWRSHWSWLLSEMGIYHYILCLA